MPFKGWSTTTSKTYISEWSSMNLTILSPGYGPWLRTTLTASTHIFMLGFSYNLIVFLR